jgi:hypothetical protein
MFLPMRPSLLLLALPLAACVGSGHAVAARHPASPSAAVTSLPAVAVAITREDDAVSTTAAPAHHHHHHAMPSGAAHE